MTDLQKAMALLMKVFNTYAGREGKSDTLTKNEAKTLLEKEFPELLQTAKNPGDIDNLMKGLDCNGDAEVDFEEFVVLVASVTCAIHDLVSKKK